jgi:uncharacterized coiled-coil protein SlyX
MPVPPKPLRTGRPCYDGDGRKYNFIAAAPDGHGFFVNPIIYEFDHYAEGERETITDTIILIASAYAEPPKPAVDRSVNELAERIRELEAKIACKRNDLAALTQRITAAEKDISAYPDLSVAIDYLEGKITHVVTLNESWRGAKVLPIEEFMKVDAAWDSDDYNRHLKRRRMLGLYSTLDERTGKLNVTWQASSYSDGSGGAHESVILCRSHEEAAGHFRRLFNELCAEVIDADNAGKEIEHCKLAQLKAFDQPDILLEWPPEIVEILSERAAKVHDNAVAHAQKNLDLASEKQRSWAPRNNVDRQP